MSRPWVVLKYGGTSVASADRWRRIAERSEALARTRRVWIVASAVAGVSDSLEGAVAEALKGGPLDDLAAVRATHEKLMAELGLTREQREPVERLHEELAGWLEGIRLTKEAPPRLVARIMAVGELASTRLGIAALRDLGVDALWVDARSLLRSDRHGSLNDHRRYLEADVPPRHDPQAAEQGAAGAQVVLTQGFIASTAEGETCLLGRGGSDTSGALFAVLLGAERLEIWSDVHGLFTADPRLVPAARLIRRIGYREAQELAAMGAKVLHPRCLPPLAAAGIPLTLHSIEHPTREGTRVEATGEDHPAVTAVTCRNGVALVNLSTLAMWRTPGFLARAFAPFDELGISVDLVATSQSAISITLDKLPGGICGAAFGQLIGRLEELGRVEVAHPCGVVSIVGRRIRTALHELAPALEVFQERPVRLVSDSAEDLNLSFVVDEEHTSALVASLHERLFPAQGGDPRLGSTWEVLEDGGPRSGAAAPWWRTRAAELVRLVADGRPRYVYHLPTVVAQARRLARCLPSIDRFYYSMKANSHPCLLQAMVREGLGIECVSAAELVRAREIADGASLLFTPNFCPVDEYRIALEAGAMVTVDGPELFEREPSLFRGASLGLRVDPGRGLGHHAKVATAGAGSKFGHPKDQVGALVTAARRAEARIVGLHAHVGSGILEPGAWAATARTLASLLPVAPDVAWLDLGGGLGVPERPGQSPLDLDEVERSLELCRRETGALRLWLEPGRYLVSEAGVLVAPVTQVRRKGEAAFIGVAVGMSSFLRPALYGAWHGIHNLSRLDAPALRYWNVVGPICESGDILGRDRLLPETSPGDVLLIENAGAYGAVMASSYNLREPAEEIVFET